MATNIRDIIWSRVTASTHNTGVFLYHLEQALITYTYTITITILAYIIARIKW